MKAQFDEWMQTQTPLQTGVPPDSFLLQTVEQIVQNRRAVNMLLIMNTDDPRIYLDDFHLVHCIDAGLLLLGVAAQQYDYDTTYLLHDTDDCRILMLFEVLL